ncbi:uncharacterized protein ARMOST_14801 [Armillaria ostoyae]|uniref:P-loop containing nucleoside triphosphate hydrolase protein n=1 Tax=Armillaria ostoyae TaxID=47428 RepID=A0A284RRP7_ARMOS|nr:uncharacterized protein ARMOST_14801 [Armillaria ostoyae]
MDLPWYQAVINACALDVNLTSIPGGDSSLAKGLSGGQKARIALARAVYARTDFVILDDVLAALDATTSAHIFSSLFGPHGLLRGSTVVMTTNHIPYLQHADWIITLGDGKIVEQGTFSDLSASPGGIGHLIRDGTITALADQAATVTGQSSDGADILNESDKDDAAKEEIEATQSRNATLRTYMHYAQGAGYDRMLIYIIFLAVTVGIQIVTPVYLQLWAEANSGGTYPHLGQYLGGYAGIEVAYAIAFTVMFYYFIMIIVPEASTKLHAGQVEAVMNEPMSFFDGTTAGRIISRFSQDIFILDFEFPLAMHDAGYECTRLFGSTILMVAAVPYLVIPLIFVAFTGYLVQLKFYLVSYFETTSSTGPYLEGTFIHPVSRNIGAQQSIDNTRHTSASVFYKAELLATCTVSKAVLFHQYRLTVAGNDNRIGLLAVALTQAVSLQDIINLVLTSWTQLEIAAVAVERNLEFTNLEPKEQSLDQGDPADKWPSIGQITFEDIVARYKPDVDPTLKGITFNVPGGSKLGICGRTGSGKSTIILVLLRALDVEGEISIDNVQISSISRRCLRRAVTVVAQDPLVTDGSVRENLDITGMLSDSEIWAVCEAVQLKDVVNGFHEKLDHPLTSHGHELSQGQMQLLALARASLRHAKIVVLDEAMGRLDAETDRAVQRIIRDHFRDSTVITVAHRVSTITDYEQVIVMDRGSVSEKGDPQDLLTTEGSAFGVLLEAVK